MSDDDGTRGEAGADAPVIEQVKGVVMLVYGVTEERAGGLLLTCAQDSNIEVLDLAERIATCLPTLSDSPALEQTRVLLNQILLVPNAHGAGRGR